MTPEQFIYWLQGKLEIGECKELNEKEVQIIKDHIALVLKKETPVRTKIIDGIQPSKHCGCMRMGCPKCDSLFKTSILTC